MDQLPREQWHQYFDHLSKQLAGLQAEVEVQSLDLGDQIEAEFLPIIGLVYDPRDDVFEVALEGVDHLIRHPVEVHIKQNGPLVDAVLIIDKDGTRHLISFREPLHLPAPQG